MESDQYSLNNLSDIVVPDAPPFWPPAPGVWVVLAMLLLAILFAGWRLHTARKQNAYRKAGLLLLGDVKTAHDVSVIMKRVALAVFPREQVASLYGDDWAEFLHKTCPRCSFLAISTTDASTRADHELVRLASTWIRHHRIPGGQARVAAQ